MNDRTLEDLISAWSDLPAVEAEQVLFRLNQQGGRTAELRARAEREGYTGAAEHFLDVENNFALAEALLKKLRES